MNIVQLHQALEKSAGRAAFVSATYTAKKHGETARYVLNVGMNYVKALESDLLEVTIRLKDARGIEKFALLSLQDSLVTSIQAHLKGEQSPDYTKKGLYVPIGNGLKMILTDVTVEIQGFVVSRIILTPGQYKRVLSSPLVVEKNRIKKDLKCGHFRTLSLDLGQIHNVRANGETIEFNPD